MAKDRFIGRYVNEAELTKARRIALGGVGGAHGSEALDVEFLLSITPAMVEEIRAYRLRPPPFELTADEHEAMVWLAAQQNGLVLANRTGAAEGELDANGDELPGDWVPTPGGLALRTLDKLIAATKKGP